MTTRPWMPLFVGDFTRDTMHLSTTQVGAYVLLIMHYWAHGELPKEDAMLRRITKLDARQWRKDATVLMSFFASDGHHKRIDRELAHVSDVQVKRREAGRAGGLAKARKSPGISQPHPHSEEALSRASASAPAHASDSVAVRKETEMPENWQPSLDTLARIRGLDLTSAQIELEIVRMRGHYRGRGETRADWDATFEKWCVQAKEEQKANGQQRDTRPGSVTAVGRRYLAAFAEQYGEEWLHNAINGKYTDETSPLPASGNGPLRRIPPH